MIEAGHKGIHEISMQGVWAKKMETLELLMYRMKLNITDEREVAVAGPGIYSESKSSESMRLPSLRSCDKHNIPSTKPKNKYSG